MSRGSFTYYEKQLISSYESNKLDSVFKKLALICDRRTEIQIKWFRNYAKMFYKLVQILFQNSVTHRYISRSQNFKESRKKIGS